MVKSISMQQNPKVTVLIPVYNGEKFLKETIQSILNQTYTNFELLIINDGSTDGSKSIILSFDDQRIRYLENEINLKLIATLNKGVELARGEYIARIDADDIAYPERLEKQVRFLDDNTEYGMVGSWCSVIDSDKQIKYHTSHGDIVFAMATYCPFIHPSVMIRKSVISNYNVVFDSNYLHAEDYELWSRIVFDTKVANITEFLTGYREHEEQISSIFKLEQIEQANKIKNNFLSRIQQKSGIDLLPLFKLKSLDQKEEIALVNYYNSLYISKELRMYFGDGAFERFLVREAKNFLLESKGLTVFNLYKLSKLEIYKKINLSFKQRLSIIVKSFII